MYPGEENTPLYNSRIIDTYIKLAKRNYSHVNISELLESANMKPYEVADQGHWFSQHQVDLFYEKILRETGNANIAREAGRYAASPEAIGAMRQYILGMLGPAKVYELIGKATSNFTRSSTYESKKLKSNKIEIVVTPNKGIQERSFQCENRMGFFDAISMVFNNKLPKMEHTECMFNGGKVCRYVISWENNLSLIFKRIRNFSLLLIIALYFVFLAKLPSIASSIYLPLSIASFFVFCLVAEFLEKRELKKSLENLRGSTDDLVEQIKINYNNTRLANEIGQAISKHTNIDSVVETVAKILEELLDYDRGLILLANKSRSKLVFRTGFGYTADQHKLLAKTTFRLDKDGSKGVFIVAFKDQKPFLINDINQIENNLSLRSLNFAKKMGSHSFICCPIICDGQSIGILAVDNLKSKRPLVQSDLSLIMGIAPIIGISIRNADLLDSNVRQFRSIIQVMAASIDARDPLTAGHSAQVTEFSLGICNQLKLSDDYQEMVRIAALLHDYGKIAIPDEILKKKGKLSQIEYEIIKTHCYKTKEILKRITFDGVYKQVPAIAAAHHEKWDGTGYPNGLRGEEIPIGARIIAVADFFEAITAQRHYRGPIPIDKALFMLREESGKSFDPKIVESFLNYFYRSNFGKVFLKASSSY